MLRIVIFANGILPNYDLAQSLLKKEDYIIAADGGANHLSHMNILPNIVIGDLDSIDQESINKVKAGEIPVKRFPADKDETDLELALGHAIDMEPTSILIVGGLGGRLDQTLANLSILNHPNLSEIDIRLDDGLEQAFFCGPSVEGAKQAEIHGKRGDTVSLIPWGGTVEGINTKGLQWPLESETLYPEKSRGISNIMLDELATVSIDSGLLLIVHRRSIQ